MAVCTLCGVSSSGVLRRHLDRSGQSEALKDVDWIPLIVAIPSRQQALVFLEVCHNILLFKLAVNSDSPAELIFPCKNPLLVWRRHRWKRGTEV